jgi:murein DD-endopeptidase MepM/ murein hydrolase activator NlpD
VKTLGVLVAGWLLGGAVIVLWSESAPAAAVRSESSAAPGASAAVSNPTVPAVTDGADLLIPVLGIEPAELKDDFAQPRGNGRTHGAIDILAPRGTPVVAAVDGTIRKIFTSKAGGLTIYQFDREEKRVYYYAHLDSYARGLAEGIVVRQGTVIGYVGTTGNAPADTPHLHFSVEDLPRTREWWKGSPVNPYPLLAQAPAVR